MNIVLVGENSAGIQSLKMLANSAHRVVAVLASKDKHNSNMADLWTVANAHGYSTWPAKLVKDPGFAEQLRTMAADVILNVHSLYVISEQVLNAARVGCFNLHPGPLPRYAGLNSVSWAIYHGENSHGVTVHKMEPGVDTGPIVYQSVFPVRPEDSALTISSKCMKLGLGLLARLLETLARSLEIPLQPQDLAQREYFGNGVPQNGCLCWSRPAREIVNFVRACDFFPFPSRWGHPRAKASGSTIFLAKAVATREPTTAPPGTVGPAQNGGVRVACGDEWIVLQKLLVDARCINAGELLKPGDRLRDGEERHYC